MSTGRFYEFSGAQLVQSVDSRDAAALLNTQLFRRAHADELLRDAQSRLQLDVVPKPDPVSYPGVRAPGRLVRPGRALARMGAI